MAAYCAGEPKSVAPRLQALNARRSVAVAFGVPVEIARYHTDIREVPRPAWTRLNARTAGYCRVRFSHTKIAGAAGDPKIRGHRAAILYVLLGLTRTPETAESLRIRRMTGERSCVLRKISL